MDFTTILNRKNSAAAAAAAEAQLHQQYLQTAHMNQHSPTMKAEPGAPENAVNAYPAHAPVPMDSGLAESFYYAQAPGSTPRNMAYVPGGYAGETQLQQAPVASESVSAEAPPKTFHCSTCNKGFARRSDLARHGMSYSLGLYLGRFLAANLDQSVFTLVSDLMPAIGPAVGNSLFNVRH